MSHAASIKDYNPKQDQEIEMLLTAFGPEITAYLQDPQVVEIMVNSDESLWVEKLGEECKDTGIKINPANSERAIRIIASTVKGICDDDTPMLSAELPGTGDRFQGVLPPIVESPTITIRKKASKVYTLNKYVEDGIMSEDQKKVLLNAVHEKKNILVVGGTGSGKTTLVNAILDEISKTGDRIIIIEDTQELQCTAKNQVCMRSKKEVTMNDCLYATMRLRPDRIVVGEVRGPEALTLLKAWNTGHPGGCATVHANSTYGGLIRLEQLIQEAIPTPQRELIAEAVDIVVFITRYEYGRIVKEVVRVEGYKKGEYVITQI
jgi:P-type conjugative transfer ATPase TrbB